MMHNEDIVKISRESWHYRAVKWMYVNRFWDEEHKMRNWRSICQYGRRFILSIFFYLLVVPLLSPAFIAAFLVSSKYDANEEDSKFAGIVSQFVVISFLILIPWIRLSLIYGWFKGVGPWYYRVVQVLAGIDLFIITVITVIFGWFFLVEPLVEKILYDIREKFRKRFKKEASEKRTASAPTILAKTYSAWKEKVCPPIEFVD